MSQALGWRMDWIFYSVLALYAPFVYLRDAMGKMCSVLHHCVKATSPWISGGHSFLATTSQGLFGIPRVNSTLTMKSIVMNKWVQRKAGRGQTPCKPTCWPSVAVRKQWTWHRMGSFFKLQASDLLEVNRRAVLHNGLGIQHSDSRWIFFFLRCNW